VLLVCVMVPPRVCIFITDQIYLKHVVDTVKVKSNWGRAYLMNLLGSVPMLISFM
jgi:hypothetical protein